MRGPGRSGGALALALVLGATAGAGAQEPAVDEADPEAQIRAAREAFEAGTEAYEAGLFEEALSSFRRAYELTGSPDLLYNIATVADRLRLDRDALEAYESYLRLRPRAEDRPNIEARIEALRRAEDRREAERDAAAATEPPDRAPATAPAEPAEDRASLSEPMVQVDEGPGAVPWIVAGTGVLVGAGGAVLLAVALSDIDAVESPEGDAPRWSEVEDAHARAPTLSAVGIAAIGVGAALLATGVTWAVVGGGGSGERAVGVSIGPGRVAVGGRF